MQFQITSVDPSTRLEILDTADIPDSNDKVFKEFVRDVLISNLRRGLFLDRVQTSAS